MLVLSSLADCERRRIWGVFSCWERLWCWSNVGFWFLVQALCLVKSIWRQQKAFTLGYWAALLASGLCYSQLKFATHILKHEPADTRWDSLDRLGNLTVWLWCAVFWGFFFNCWIWNGSPSPVWFMIDMLNVARCFVALKIYCIRYSHYSVAGILPKACFISIPLKAECVRGEW